MLNVLMSCYLKKCRNGENLLVTKYHHGKNLLLSHGATMMVNKSIMMMLHLGEVLWCFGAQQISDLFSCWTKIIAIHLMGIGPELLNIAFINDDDNWN